MNYNYVISSVELTDKPVSSLLCSNFIELGYGLQVEGMWGEMFFNRSFEYFPHYRNDNKDWFDLWNDPKDRSKGFADDWSQFDWYHSGYEHNPWFAAPGSGKAVPIDDEADFIIKKSAECDVEISRMEGGFHGKLCLRIENREKNKRGGLGQYGKYLRKGETYKFRGMFKSIKGGGNAVIEFYPEGEWISPVASYEIDGIDNCFSQKSIEFKNDSFEGRAAFILWIPAGAVMEVDDFSLMPADTFYGWRNDVVEACRHLNPKVIRWPGGCFASFYDWRYGIGKYSNRIPTPSYFWGGLNYNDAGTGELAMLCGELGAESMVCVNLHHPKKSKYYSYPSDIHGYNFMEFIDPAAGIKLAEDWVAYCNAEEPHPMAKLRKEHGYHAPFRIKYWEMDNEVYRWFTAEEYGEACIKYSRAMKTVDPSIKTGMVIYWDHKFDNIEDREKNLRLLLDIAGKDIDFLADRGPDDENVGMKVQVMREYNKKHGTELKYCNTEWLPYDGFPDEFNNYENKDGFTNSFLFSKWRYAMNIFRHIMMWQRYGGDILFVNFNNLANTHAQCAIDTPKEGVFLTASGKALEFLSRSPAAWPLEIKGYKPGFQDSFQVQAAWDIDRKQLVIYIFNQTGEEQTVEFDLSSTGKTFSTGEVSEIYANDLLSMNTMENPGRIKCNKKTVTDFTTGESYSITVPKYSFVQSILS